MDLCAVFFFEISDSLVAALSRSFEVGQLSTSQRQAVILLTEKKDKDKRLIKNWRPIQQDPAFKKVNFDFRLTHFLI